jgi:branched-chain amino acid aminotransferase
MHLDLPDNPDQIKQNLNTVISMNNYSNDVAVRITVFIDGINSWASLDTTDYFIAPIEKKRNSTPLVNGKTALISSWNRISDNVMPPRAKVGANYINSRYAHLQANSIGYDVPIFLNDLGFIAEGAGACIFLLKKGRLVTPSLTCSILESITRDTIITLATKLGMEVEQRQVNRTELYLADEVFLCGTAAEITPIIKVDNYSIGCGAVGEVTQSIINYYHKVVSAEIVEFSHWCHPLTEDRTKNGLG